MATSKVGVDLSGINDPQQPIAFGLGLLLIVVGTVGITGIIDVNVGFGDGLVFGLFGVPLWLAITALVAGVIGIVLSLYEGAGTTFNKVAAGLVLPPVLLLAITDWGFAVGNPLTMALGIVTLLLAVVFVVVGLVLLHKRPLSLVLPVVAVLTLADLGLGLTEMVPTTESINLFTLALLLVLEIAVGFVAYEGGRRVT